MLLELNRRQRNDDEATVGNDGERELALLVIGAAEFEYLDRAAANLVIEHVAQHHHIVGNELLAAKARDRSVVLRAFSREQRGDAHTLERRRDSKQLPAHD